MRLLHFWTGLLLVSSLVQVSPAQDVQAQSATDAKPKLESCKPISERTGSEGCWQARRWASSVTSHSSVVWTSLLTGRALKPSQQAAAPYSTHLAESGY